MKVMSTYIPRPKLEPQHRKINKLERDMLCASPEFETVFFRLMDNTIENPQNSLARDAAWVCNNCLDLKICQEDAAKLVEGKSGRIWKRDTPSGTVIGEMLMTREVIDHKTIFTAQEVIPNPRIVFSEKREAAKLHSLARARGRTAS